MHMADALLSPAVGGAAWAATAGLLAYSARKIRSAGDTDLTPLMGVLGAFVFAAQMINFAIPATGSSGHIGGGLLLAVLLGAPAAFVVIASVLTVQALLFADGGLLALGANIFNLGFFPCFVAYLLIFRPLAGRQPSDARLAVATVLATVIGLQLGALAVVLETRWSGISSLPFETFLWLMQPIHLAIGLVEGIATAALLIVVRRTRPDLLTPADPAPKLALKPVLASFVIAAAVIAGGFSLLASEAPDGLEWSIEKASGQAELAAVENGVHARLAEWQARIAPMPDYQAPVVDAAPATSLAGLVGGAVTLAVIALLGWALRRWRRR